MSEIIAKPPERVVRTAFNWLDIDPRTKLEYQTHLADFLKFANLHGLTIDSFLEYKQHLAERSDIGVSAKNKYLVSARNYLREMHRRGIIPVDITLNVKGFSQTKKHKRVGLTEDEVERLIDWLNHDIDPSDPYNTRLKAIVALLLFQGLRQCEVSRLNIKDVDLKHGLIYIHGKGRDDKEPVFLLPQTKYALDAYLTTNEDIYEFDGNMNLKDSPLFVSNSNSSQRHRLSTRGIHSIITPVIRNLGIEKTVHGFRHYFTTALIKHYEGQLLEVARYTRHKSLSMLQVYNDAIKQEADLPYLYKAFDNIQFEI